MRLFTARTTLLRAASRMVATRSKRGAAGERSSRESVNLLGRSLANVPEEDVVAVGVETERQFAALFDLDVKAILFGLLAADFSILGRLLGFNDGERFAVFPEKNVV